MSLHSPCGDIGRVGSALALSSMDQMNADTTEAKRNLILLYGPPSLRRADKKARWMNGPVETKGGTASRRLPCLS